MTTPAHSLGRRESLEADLAALGDPTLTAARVLAQHRVLWLVAAPGGPSRMAPARGRLRETEDGGPVTGDWVAVDAEGAITAVLPRHGTIIRRAAGPITAGQMLAANVDLALIVEPLPDPNPQRMERLVALARAGGVDTALVVTKADLVEDAHALAAVLARRLGVTDAVAVNSRDTAELGLVRQLLSPGATAVLLGPSGAGKSTLVNGLLGSDRQATGTVRADGRGRHTTVGRELIALPGGALLIDTPGMREVGLWDEAEDAFTDIDELALGCKFSDCAHTGEPGCNVAGVVDAERLEAWRKLAREQKWIDDRRAAARDREASGRSHARTQIEARHAKGNRDDD